MADIPEYIDLPSPGSINIFLLLLAIIALILLFLVYL